MPPTPTFVLRTSDVDYLNTIIAGASSIELLAQITVRAQSEDALAHLTSRLVALIDQLATYAHIRDQSAKLKLH